MELMRPHGTPSASSALINSSTLRLFRRAFMTSVRAARFFIRSALVRKRASSSQSLAPSTRHMRSQFA
jgi:hypothetical protein